MAYLIENNNKPKNVTEIHYLQKMCEKPTSKEVGWIAQNKKQCVCRY